MKISIEKLEFPKAVKTQIVKFINTSRIKIEFINESRIKIAKTNMSLFEPHKIIFTKDKKSLIIILYEDNLFYSYDLSNHFSFKKLIKLVNEKL